MTEAEMVEAYIRLFRGRGDVYGNFTSPHAVREPLTPDRFANHLYSTDPKDWIGVYPHLGQAMDQHVTWGCVDIDGKDFPTDIEGQWDWFAMWGLASKLRKVLAVKGIHAHVERTRNGYHLWVFPEGGHAPAVHMRRAFMAACAALNYAPKEVNPKQEELLPGKIGNWVRLPYPGHLTLEGGPIGQRHFVSPDDEYMNLPQFLESVQLTNLGNLAAVAELWTPPQRQTFDGPPPEDVEAVLSVVSGKAFTIWRDGPLEGRDRSNTLAKLAYTLSDEGIQMPAAFTVVKDADRRWGKFADRPDCDEQIMKFIERAYSK